MARLTATREVWPIRGTFRISRGAKREAVVVVAEARDGELVGRGEAVPYARYGESVDAAVAALDGLEVASRSELAAALPPGAARAAADAALWELEAARSGKRIAELAGVPPARPIPTLRTISIDAPAAMAKAARALGASHLKLKLAGDGRDVARAEAVHAAAPRALLVADPNESWTADDVARLGPRLVAAGVTMIEQPVAAGEDADLADVKVAGLAICADESVHVQGDLAQLVGRYDAINVKLEKSGGLTEALGLVREARALGFGIMIGCMVCTSLAIAPAFLFTGEADLFDLDGPLLLERDRPGGVTLQNGLLHPPTSIWGRTSSVNF